MIGAISDLHFHNWKDFAKTVDGVNSRYDFIRKSVREAYVKASELGCTSMVVCGDIFHVRGTLKTSVLNMTRDLFNELSNRYLRTYVISGNHDMETFSIDRHSSAVSAICSDYIICVDNKCIDGVCGIPYIHNIDEFKVSFEEMASKHKPKYMLIHQGIDDFKPMSSTPDSKLTAQWLHDVSTKYNNEMVVFCGHYHKPMSFKNIINVGAIVQHSFGGSGQDRGLWTSDAKFFPLDVAPKFKVLNDTDLKDKNIDKVIANSYVKVRTSSIRDLDKISKKSRVDLSDIRVEVEKEFKSSHSVSIEISDTQTMLKKYLEDVLELDKMQSDRLLNLYSKVIKGSIDD